MGWQFDKRGAPPCPRTEQRTKEEEKQGQSDLSDHHRGHKANFLPSAAADCSSFVAADVSNALMNAASSSRGLS